MREMIVMGKFTHCISIALVFLFFTIGTGYGEDNGAVKVENGERSFESVYDNLNPKDNTDLHIRAFWKKVNGVEVVWEGKVYDVKGGRGRAKIFLSHEGRPSEKRFNMLLTCYDVSKAAALKKGQHIRFSAILYKYKRSGSSGLVLYLDNAEIM